MYIPQRGMLKLEMAHKAREEQVQSSKGCLKSRPCFDYVAVFVALGQWTISIGQSVIEMCLSLE